MKRLKAMMKPNKKSNDSFDKMDSLVDDLLMDIFQFLSPKEFTFIQCTNKRFKKITSPTLPRISQYWHKMVFCHRINENNPKRCTILTREWHLYYQELIQLDKECQLEILKRIKRAEKWKKAQQQTLTSTATTTTRQTLTMAATAVTSAVATAATSAATTARNTITSAVNSYKKTGKEKQEEERKRRIKELSNKNSELLHVACQHSLSRAVKYLLTFSYINIYGNSIFGTTDLLSGTGATGAAGATAAAGAAGATAAAATLTRLTGLVGRGGGSGSNSDLYEKTPLEIAVEFRQPDKDRAIIEMLINHPEMVALLNDSSSQNRAKTNIDSALETLVGNLDKKEIVIKRVEIENNNDNNNDNNDKNDKDNNDNKISEDGKANDDEDDGKDDHKDNMNEDNDTLITSNNDSNTEDALLVDIDIDKIDKIAKRNLKLPKYKEIKRVVDDELRAKIENAACYLISKGAVFSEKNMSLTQTPEIRSFLWHSCYRNRPYLLTFLIKLSKMNLTATNGNISRSCITDANGSDQSTPLHISAMLGHSKIIEILLAAIFENVRSIRTLNDIVGIDNNNGVMNDYNDAMSTSYNHINVMDNKGNTPLILAIKHNAYEAMRTLIAYGADVNMRFGTSAAENGDGMTPCCLACDRGDLKTLQILLMPNGVDDTDGANIFLPDLNGKTALMYATYKGRYDVIEFIYNYLTYVKQVHDDVTEDFVNQQEYINGDTAYIIACREYNVHYIKSNKFGEYYVDLDGASKETDTTTTRTTTTTTTTTTTWNNNRKKKGKAGKSTSGKKVKVIDAYKRTLDTLIQVCKVNIRIENNNKRNGSSFICETDYGTEYDNHLKQSLRNSERLFGSVDMYMRYWDWQDKSQGKQAQDKQARLQN